MPGKATLIRICSAVLSSEGGWRRNGETGAPCPSRRAPPSELARDRLGDRDRLRDQLDWLAVLEADDVVLVVRHTREALRPRLVRRPRRDRAAQVDVLRRLQLLHQRGRRDV